MNILTAVEAFLMTANAINQIKLTMMGICYTPLHFAVNSVQNLLSPI
jgi:hypothetical protein